MEILEYINQKKELYNHLIDYIESQNDDINDYENLINFLDGQKISENKNELRLFLHLILRISNNHFRHPGFRDQIQKILLHFEASIKQNFSNNDIFYIFNSNKIILLFLLEKQIITIDQSMANFFISKSDKKYDCYFYPEIKNFVSKKKLKTIERKFDQNILTNFEQMRHLGENQSEICNLIRNDSVEEFIAYVNRRNISLLSKINTSIFETNAFLDNKNPSLIEYAAFYGSFQIFQYLRMNNVKLEPNLWLYAIHGKNAEIIHLIEGDKIVPESYEMCFKEAIKCHHNDIANYIKDNFLDEKINNLLLLMNFDENSLKYSFHYYNHFYLPTELKNNFIFYYACKYDYFTIVQLLPIFLAADNNNIEIVNLLLKQKEIQIGPYCFEGCTYLTEITIPSTITTIEYFAFHGCSSLKKVIIPSSVTKIESSSFDGCSSLTEITIPSTVTEIKSSAFNDCSSLKQIIIPSSVEKIEECTFSGCSSLNQISLPSSLTSISQYLFSRCFSLAKIQIPNLVLSIEGYAFSYCSSLIEITIPSSVTEIGWNAFEECSKLTSIIIPSSVTQIGISAFSKCTSLAQVKFSNPSSLTLIGENAFSDCSSLALLTIPISVNRIGNSAFYGCTSLKQIIIPSSLYSDELEINSNTNVILIVK